VGLNFEAAGGWPAVLGRLMKREDLGADLAAAALGQVLEGNAGAAQTAALIVGLRMKGETVEEMTGLVQAMLDHSLPLRPSYDTVDTCGTGGDRSGTINVSTMAALIVAGAGVPVCKHGGRAASSRTGSADVLEELGVVIDLGPEGVMRCLDEAGIGFCFAPRFHPAMRHAAPVRAELGVPTVFNFLGPLSNPARAPYQVLGVSDPAMAERMIGVLAALGSRRALVVHGHDGLDELTTTTTSTVVQLDPAEDARLGAARERTYLVDPAGLGLQPARREDLLGDDVATNARIVRDVLSGKPGPHRDIALLNAAAGLVAAGAVPDLVAGLDRAAASVDSGGAVRCLELLCSVSQAAAIEASG